MTKSHFVTHKENLVVDIAVNKLIVARFFIDLLKSA
ncbi:hypothetical protein JOE11_003929 [Robbsia andropogonis]